MCNCKIIDLWGESFILIGGIAATVILVYTAITLIPIIPIFSGICIVGYGIAGWRVRKLGVSRNLMESVDMFKEENQVYKKENQIFKEENQIFKEENQIFKEENQVLKEEVNKLNYENKKFEEMIGLLGNEVKDVDEIKEKLFKLYNDYKKENDRYEGNNLLNLFRLVDINNDSCLSKEEMIKMSRYAKIFYNEEFDFNEFDFNKDENVSIEEFVQKFKKIKENIV